MLWALCAELSGPLRRRSQNRRVVRNKTRGYNKKPSSIPSPARAVCSQNECSSRDYASTQPCQQTLPIFLPLLSDSSIESRRYFIVIKSEFDDTDKSQQYVFSIFPIFVERPSDNLAANKWRTLQAVPIFRGRVSSCGAAAGGGAIRFKLH